MTEPHKEATGEVSHEVQRDISEGIPEMSLRPRAESTASSQQQQQQVSGGRDKGKKFSVSKAGKSAGKGDKSKSSRRPGKKDKDKAARSSHKKETIDDNQSEVSYQPDTDLSRSKASKKVVSGKPSCICIRCDDLFYSFPYSSFPRAGPLPSHDHQVRCSAGAHPGH